MKEERYIGMREMLEGFTDDVETLVEFEKATGRRWKARERCRQHFFGLVKAGECAKARRYAEQNPDFITYRDLKEMIRAWVVKLMDSQPGKALKLAREYNFPDLILQAAVKRSELILAEHYDVDPALEIARQERADDEDYRKRVAHHAFGNFIKHRNFSRLPSLVTEFRSFFSDEEAELAEVLARAEKQRHKRQDAAIAAS